jgi:hypothetical protein
MTSSRSAGPAAGDLRLLGLFFVAACLASLWIYRGAMHGTFLSDDTFFVVGLAKHPFDWGFVAKAFNPWGALKFEVMNYAPLYVLVSRAEWSLFADDTYGYHVVNVILHALNATLLVALASSAGVKRGLALFAGAFFLLHPANVETVAWISNLRAILAMGCAIGAVLAVRLHPATATALFAAGLLFKASASFALPLVLALAWCNTGAPTAPRPPISRRWLAAWLACFALYAIPQFATWGYFGEAQVARYTDAAEQLRSMAAIGTRYLLMAATSIGVSAFQEPEPARSWLDPWWLASLPIAAVLLWRLVGRLARGKVEGAYWLGAAAAFGPISQITPFYFAMGDRYIYFVLPALIVASLLWWQEIAATCGRGTTSATPWWNWGRGALFAAGVAGLSLFASWSSARALLWVNQMPLAREGAANFPNGGLAHWLRTVDRISQGDISGGMREFEGVIDTGYYSYVSLFAIPEFAQYHQHPELVALRKRLARMAIDDLEKLGTPSQKQMRMAATAHYFLGEYDAALAKFEAALAMEGPDEEKIRHEIAVVRETIVTPQEDHAP